MNKPTEGPFGPKDHKSAPERPSDPTKDAASGDAWTDALRALRSIARPHEPAAGAPSAPTGTTAPAPGPAPQEALRGSPPVDETLAALQLLARRYGPAAASPADQDAQTAPPEHAAADPSDEEPYAGELDQPTPSARMLQRKRPSWASLALITVSAAVLAVLLVGALSLWRQLFHAGDMRSERPSAPVQEVAATASTAASTPAPTVVAVAPPTLAGATDLRAIERAMNDCDLEAARNPDALHFLIVPMVSPTRDYTPWAPRSVGDIGTSVTLLRSKDALDGLRNGSLAIYSGAYRFSIIDSSNDATHAWQAVIGVAKLAKADAATIAGFRVRFGFADFVGDTSSNFRFPRNKGVCYWVSALLRT